MNLMKKVITVLVTLFIVGALAFGLNSLLKPTAESKLPAAVPTVRDKNAPPSDLIMGDRLENSGLRFDGVYHARLSDLHYYMRFYPAGHVAMVGGPEGKDNGSLRTMLRPSVLTQPSIGLYNIPVKWSGDSLFMTAHGPKGYIIYRARIEGAERLSVLKESKVNGRKKLIPYIFEADGTEVSAEQGK
ncbi:MAG: hypothetical protein WAU70_05540 [Flavobacteriales bacterium]